MHTPQFSFEAWVKWVFDHPVAAKSEKEWWWAVPDADEGGRWLDRPPWRAIRYMTRLFEDPVPPLKPYSDEQIDQGLWFIFHNANSKHIDWLVSEEVSLPHRRQFIRAIVPLYRKLILPRSAQTFPRSDALDRPLNSIGFMLWDFVCHANRVPWGDVKWRRLIKREQAGRLNWPLYYARPSPSKVTREVLHACSELVATPHLAGQGAALHGLNHLEQNCPGSAHVLIDRYLTEHPDIDPHLREYAIQARAGKCQ